MDVDDDIIERCIEVYEQPEQECQDDCDKYDDVISNSSGHTIESEMGSKKVERVNFQWVFNSKYAKKRLDEHLFPTH